MINAVLALVILIGCVYVRHLCMVQADKKRAVRRVLNRIRGLYSFDSLPPAKEGYMWKRVDFDWIEVCDTCGGNCGQCGDSFKDARCLPALEIDEA